MTGRLVILRHKSWHVWNQDNQEKVLRDERLQREAADEALNKERKVNQEFAAETLKSRSSVPEKAEHINLFEDASHVGSQNSEYLKEKEEKKLQELKREGIAPLAFGAGSIEKEKKIPWYNHVPGYSSGMVKPKSGEEQRKSKSDPMSNFVKSNPYPNVANAMIDSERRGNRHSLKDQKAEDVNDGTSGMARKERKSRDNHEHKSHKHHKTNKLHHSSKHVSQDKITSSSHSNGSGATATLVDLVALRKRRLEREKAEHRRETQLLAVHDIYGPAR